MKSHDNYQRLSKIMAQAGVASRRHCEEIIFAGRVFVNGKKTIIPQTMVGPEDSITVDGNPISVTEKKIYYILNKPKGYVCSTDPFYKNRVLDLFKECPYRLFTVGRLDKDTTGLLIVTNDGHYAQKVIHPSSDIEKEYIATVHRPITEKHIKAIAKGVTVENTFVKPEYVEAIEARKVKIIIKEGKKREVRILIKEAELNVIDLKRTRIGKLSIGRLSEGTWRNMTEKEKTLIFEKETNYET